jgi:hypothetical protein
VEVLDGLSTLVDHSLVQPVPGPEGARFRLLETIRMFAAERHPVEETERVRRRHAEAYLAMAEDAAPHLPGRGQPVLLARLEADHDNLRAAVDWAVDNGEVELALRFGAGLWRFWQISGHVVEGRERMSRILAMPGAEKPTRERVRALDADGGLRYWGADLPGANERYEEQLELARALGDPKATAEAMFNLAHTRFLIAGGTGPSDEMLLEARRIFEEVGDEVAAARVQWTLTNLLLRKDEPARARADMIEGRARFRELGDDWYVALADGTLSWAELVLGNVDGAIEHGIRSFRLSHEMGDVASTTIGLRGAAIYATVAGLAEEAAVLAGAFEALCVRYGVRPPAFFEEISAPSAGPEALRIRTEDFPEATARGAQMSLDEIVDYTVRLFEDHARRRAGVTHAG